jgi:hypothetical protein
VEVFTKWVNKINTQMDLANRKILLLLDKATNHSCPGDELEMHSLKAIKFNNAILLFLLANTTLII